MNYLISMSVVMVKIKMEKLKVPISQSHLTTLNRNEEYATHVSQKKCAFPYYNPKIMMWNIPLKRVNKYEVPWSAKITTLKRTLQVIHFEVKFGQLK